MLHEDAQNPFMNIYRTAASVFRERSVGTIILNPQLRLVVEEGALRPRENLPVGEEIAILIPDECEEPSYRDIVLARREADGRSGRLQKTNLANAATLPLAYPLMLPYGDHGFRLGLELPSEYNTQRQNLGVSTRMFYRFHLFPRSSTQIVPFSFGRLFQQFIVDIWAQIEQDFLNWNRLHTDSYDRIGDAITRNPAGSNSGLAGIGHRVILPSSFLGGDRFIAACYQDSMAIVRRFGKPALFITFTANPQWPEIRRELRPGEDANNRPDLVDRVFQLKKKALLEDLRHRYIFGKFLATVWTIEYQKRCLPHCHILLFLSMDDLNRLLDPRYIDRAIRAEFPLPEEDPDGVLTQTVESLMIHGPCGADKPSAPCIELRDGRYVCTKVATAFCGYSERFP